MRDLINQLKTGKDPHYCKRVTANDGALGEQHLRDFQNSENTIRPIKLGAKNWMFLGNEESGEKCAILNTLVENCSCLGINPKEYLTDVLIRLPSMLAKNANTLTPTNWLKARNGKAIWKAA